MQKVLVVDNYDSFTYNLVHALEALGAQVAVFRNNEFNLEELDAFPKILLSPGPGIPSEAGLLKEVVLRYAPTKSMLGVCLGQQAIAEVFGGTIVNLERVYHGIDALIDIIADDEPLFLDLPKTISVGRYHSWAVAKSLPQMLEATSIDAQGEIMSLRHKVYDVRGVQFHPESILTPNGRQILQNWLAI